MLTNLPPRSRRRLALCEELCFLSGELPLVELGEASEAEQDYACWWPGDGWKEWGVEPFSDEDRRAVGSGDNVDVFYRRKALTSIDIQEEDGDFLFGTVASVRDGHLSYGRRVRLPRSRIVEIDWGGALPRKSERDMVLAGRVEEEHQDGLPHAELSTERGRALELDEKRLVAVG